MKLFVTGGAGFIGSNFIRYWLKKYPDHQIINFDKLTYAGNLSNLKDIENNPHYFFIQGDICDQELVARAMAGSDTVVHFAAESHVDRSILDSSEFIRTNVMGTESLLKASLTNNIKHFHHVSTDEVFGSLELGSSERFSETTAYQPNSPYAASKASSDLLVGAYHKTYGLKTTISNTSNNYGPWQFPEKLIPLMTISALFERALPVYGDGLNIRDWIHVEDHCRAIELIINQGRAGETYCVGGDSEVSNLEVVKKIINITNKTEDLIEFVPDRKGHDRRYAIDSSKIKRELGFTHKHSFDEALNETVKWYAEHRSWWQPLLTKESNYFSKQYGQE